MSKKMREKDKVGKDSKRWGEKTGERDLMRANERQMEGEKMGERERKGQD